MDSEERRRAEIAGTRLHPKAIVLDLERKLLVQSVSTGNGRIRIAHKRAHRRQIPYHWVSEQHGSLFQGLQLPSRGEDEPKREMQRLVNEEAFTLM